MISYLDKTFCPFWEKCLGADTCGRAMTDEVISGAKESGLPICQISELPPCFDPDLSELIDGE